MELIKKMSSDYAEYLKDESRTTGHADSISFPRDESEIRGILSAMSREKTKVTVQGARTGLTAGSVPFGGHIMNLSRMNRALGMRKNEKGRFCLTVQPGVVLSQLRKNIEEKRFGTDGWSDESLSALADFAASDEMFFPTDPTESSACLGGIVSCNASGARSFLYGPARGHITALRIALCDGRMISLRRSSVFANGRSLALKDEEGGTMVFDLPTYDMPKTKNASGYYIEDNMDAIDLFIGSDGTLGVITEIEIELLPLPKFIWGVSSFFRYEDDAVAFVRRVRENISDVAAIEYFDGNAIEILRAQKKRSAAFAQLPDVPESAACCVYTELHCADGETALERLFAVGGLLTKSGGSEDVNWVARNSSDLQSLQFFRHAVPESVNMLIDERRKKDARITKLGTDMSVPNEYLEKVIEMYRADLSSSGLQSAAWGHIGNNHLHVNILPRDDKDFEAGKALYKVWAGRITQMGGAVSAEHGIGKLKAPFLEIMYGREHVLEMARLKRAFDPDFILGHGNLFSDEIIKEASAQ